jgi:crotonobetainyl-CoA:carnitine CoA-transferase CaiB-like acyl-CoA transferase
MGAEVIKVEDPDGGDYARLYPPLMRDGSSALFHALNRGKQSVTLDLKQKADYARFLSLLSTADVLVETFRPGVLAKLGASPQQLLQRFPSLIVCSISGYGQTGPDALRAGHDVNYLAKAGALGVMEKPALLPVQVADIAGGSYPAAVQILAALRHKEKTGKGAIIGQIERTCWAGDVCCWLPELARLISQPAHRAFFSCL